jgi:hypothetical protein
MKLFLAALTIWSLPLLGISCGSANVQVPASKPTPETITLTNQHPTGSFPLQPDLLKNLPTGAEVPPVFASLQVEVTKVVNPNARAVTIFVYLSRPNEKRDNPEKIEVGSFSLYPVDRPGSFTLDPKTAFRKASAASNDTNIKDWRLVFELEQKPEQAPSSLEVTIAKPISIMTRG